DRACTPHRLDDRDVARAERGHGQGDERVPRGWHEAGRAPLRLGHEACWSNRQPRSRRRLSDPDFAMTMVTPTTAHDQPIAEAAPPAEMPLRIGRPAEFDAVRRFFRANQFDERTVCAALDIPDMGRVQHARGATIDPAVVPAALLSLIDLFIFES